MIKLTRTVRFCLTPEITACYDSTSTPRKNKYNNTYAASPNYSPFAQYHEFDVTCYGNIDKLSGYFINIKEIDNVVHTYAIPELQQKIISSTEKLQPQPQPQFLISDLFQLINSNLNNTLSSLTWRLTPYHHITITNNDDDEKNNKPMINKCTVNQQFEFAASHRLHCPSLSKTENQKLFGKCNRPNGHGHNYRLEVAISAQTSQQTEPVNLNLLENIVNQTIIQKFDHTYLNVDCKEFENLNPTVENIAMTCYKLLKPELENENMQIHQITVWETDKTSCTYTE